jgi:chorismate lyase / 3-hydroxybenzoate synthase
MIPVGSDVPSPLPSASPTVPALAPHPPQWVYDLLGLARRLSPGLELQSANGGPLSLLTIAVPRARDMSVEGLRSAVADAYVAIGQALVRLERQPIRFWNFVPGPGQLMGPGLDRYMVFNAGRHAGFADWFGGRDNFGCALATASGVGVDGRDLVVHCLASDEPGCPVENPRQRPAYRYSQRYGPLPPCFARATIATLGGAPRLLIGGTASIVGEDSLHARDIVAQVNETLSNLEALIAAGGGSRMAGGELARLEDLRVYVVNPDDAPVIQRIIAARCPNATTIEMALSQVCRPELLVEIEGVARL